LNWYKVASHLGVPVEELKGRVTYTEFLEWLEFLEWDHKHHAKADHYLAQIAAEIRRANVKSPARIKVQDFLFEWKEVPAGAEDRCMASKKAWASALRINLEQN